MSKKYPVTPYRPRVRMLRLDVYKAVVTHLYTAIKNIVSYECTHDQIIIQYSDRRYKTYTYNGNHEELGKCIKIINKYLKKLRGNDYVAQ